MPPRPPKWSRDETILALDLYLASGHKVLDKRRPEVVELAALLNTLNAREPDRPPGTPRTGGGVAAKLANLRALDPTNPGTGFSNVSALDREVWDDYADDPTALSQAIRVIFANRTALK